ncbi:MAG: hypothetical protein JW956_13450 [Calditrichaceae bacterium]|nr:hypothetical protein [Calditrichaceae bacterium]
MKKICLLLPDKIFYSVGGARSHQGEKIDVTAEILIDALCTNDYHESYRFNRKEITVLSIETIDDKRS